MSGRGGVDRELNEPLNGVRVSPSVGKDLRETAQAMGIPYAELVRLGVEAVLYHADLGERQPLYYELRKRIMAEPIVDPEEMAKQLRQNWRRRSLPKTREGGTHHFSIFTEFGEEIDGYVIVSVHEDGLPAEIFVRMGKMGHTVSGMMDAWSITASLALQAGCPIWVLCNKLRNTSFQPSGRTQNPTIRVASSIVDYVVRWIELKYGGPWDAEGNVLPKEIL